MNVGMVGCALLAMLIVPISAEAQSYTLSDLGSGEGGAINSAGQVVGSSLVVGSTYGGEYTRFATIWNNGTPSLLGSTGAFYSGATDINNAGVAVGYLDGGGAVGAEALVFKGSTTIVLPGSSVAGEIPYAAIHAAAISNNGIVVGTVQGLDTLVGAVWSSGCSAGASSCTLTVLPGVGQTPGHGELQSDALGINSAGVVVGNSTLSSGQTVAALWHGTTPTALGAVPGAIYSSAVAINAAGTIIGDAILPNLTSVAVVWHGLNATPLSLLPGTTQDYALAINSAGVIVGEDGGDATVWRNGKPVNLNTEFASQLPAGFTLEEALGINDAGQIVADAFDSKTNAAITFVLTPTRTPEIDPGSAASGLALLLSGLAILQGRRRSVVSRRAPLETK